MTFKTIAYYLSLNQLDDWIKLTTSPGASAACVTKAIKLCTGCISCVTFWAGEVGSLWPRRGDYELVAIPSASAFKSMLF
jgi:hypothetical protein